MDPSDARKIIAFLTSKGNAVTLAASKRIDEFSEEIFNKTNNTERLALLYRLRHITNITVENSGTNTANVCDVLPDAQR
ncbi:hypothetical protein [Eoetvoesiella caeni]